MPRAHSLIRVSSRARRAAAHPRPAPQRPLHRIVVVGQRPLVEQLVPAHRSHRTKLACTSSPTVTVVGSLIVGDLRMWLYRSIPATHDKCVGADHSLPATGRCSPPGYGAILSSVPLADDEAKR
jgi:hypothetical protein